MNDQIEPALMEWLCSPRNPAVGYLASRDLVQPQPSQRDLAALRSEMLDWPPLQEVLTLQQPDGSFPHMQKTPTAQPTFWALYLMERCGMDATDEPVARALALLTERHFNKGALSYTTGGSGVLPCYLGVVTRAIISLAGLDNPLAASTIDWLVDYQRFDHKDVRAGGDKRWPYRAVVNYRCWESVSCYHGVVAALRTLSAIPSEQRSPGVHRRGRPAARCGRTVRLR